MNINEMNEINERRKFEFKFQKTKEEAIKYIENINNKEQFTLLKFMEKEGIQDKLYELAENFTDFLFNEKINDEEKIQCYNEQLKIENYKIYYLNILYKNLHFQKESCTSAKEEEKIQAEQYFILINKIQRIFNKKIEILNKNPKQNYEEIEKLFMELEKVEEELKKTTKQYHLNSIEENNINFEKFERQAQCFFNELSNIKNYITFLKENNNNNIKTILKKIKYYFVIHNEYLKTINTLKEKFKRDYNEQEILDILIYTEKNLKYFFNESKILINIKKEEIYNNNSISFEEIIFIYDFYKEIYQIIIDISEIKFLEENIQESSKKIFNLIIDEINKEIKKINKIYPKLENLEKQIMFEKQEIEIPRNKRLKIKEKVKVRSEIKRIEQETKNEKLKHKIKNLKYIYK
jgi:hypothetical protein